MKRFRFTAFALVLIVLLSSAAPAAFADEVSEVPDTTAAAVLLADLNSDLVLFSRNEDEHRAPASLTKIMTVLLAVEKVEQGRFSYEDMVEAMEDCRNGMDSDSTTANIYPGEIMSLKDLIYCAMLGSANEACNIIARYMAGSVSEFVGWMNARAQELGCTNTSFVNTNGLTAEGHYTTARDLYLITKEAMSHSFFATACSTVTYETAPTNTSEARTLKSTNALICSDSIYGDQYLYKSASGVKTGHTNAAGFCLVSTAEQSGIRLVCIVLGCEGNYETKVFKNFEDTINLYNWAFKNYEYQMILSLGTGVEKVQVDLAKDDAVAILHPESDVRLLLRKDYDPSQLDIRTTVYEDLLVAPIPAGTVLGIADIYVKGEKLASVNLVNNMNIELSRNELFKRQFKTVTSSVWFKLGVILFVVIIACYLLLVVRYRKLRQKHLREKKLAEIRRRQEWQQKYQQEDSRGGQSYYSRNAASAGTRPAASGSHSASASRTVSPAQHTAYKTAEDTSRNYQQETRRYSREELQQYFDNYGYDTPQDSGNTYTDDDLL